MVPDRHAAAKARPPPGAKYATARGVVETGRVAPEVAFRRLVDIPRAVVGGGGVRY